MLNCKVRCISAVGGYEEGKIYNIVDGRMKWHNDNYFYTQFKSIGELDEYYVSKFELVEELPIPTKEMLKEEDYIVLCTVTKAMSRYDEIRETKLSLKRNLKELKKESIKVRTQIEQEIHKLKTQLSYLSYWIDKIDED